MSKPVSFVRPLALLFILLVPITLFSRWGWVKTGMEQNFRPRPDSLEYAAGAQSIAAWGEYFLQVGPYRVPPRYPPGWPLQLSLAVRAGVPAPSLWHVTGAFSALLAFLLASTVYVAGFLILDHEDAPHLRRGLMRASFGAALFTGLVWSFAPMPAFTGKSLLSDEPALFFTLSSYLLILAGSLVIRRRPESSRWPLFLLGGLFLGITASMRFLNAALLILPLAVLYLGRLRSDGIVKVSRQAMWTAAGSGAALLLVSFSTASPPWNWSGYNFWIPFWHSDISMVLNIDYALYGNRLLGAAQKRTPSSHFLQTGQVLLGLPGKTLISYLGPWWPTLGWVGMAISYTKGKAADRADRPFAGIMALSLMLWVAGHAAFSSLYFYPAPRFLLCPLAICLLFFSLGGLCLIRQGSRAVRISLYAAALIVLSVTIHKGGSIPVLKGETVNAEQVAARFHHWLELSESRQRAEVVPFNSVLAQALGLMSPDNFQRIKAWGPLPRDVHVWRLISNGTMPEDAAVQSREKAKPRREMPPDSR